MSPYINATDKQSSIYFIIAISLLTLNILNITVWAFGHYINSIIPAIFILCFFIFSLNKIGHTTIIFIVLLLAIYIILSSPVYAWDARSIWFFHAKRIFYDNNLYAQLDGYAGWSHDDYPVLVPALAASMARTVGYWNEVLPRLSVLLALFPIFLVYGWLIRRNLYFTIWVSGILLICRFSLVDGYMDAILALYCGAAVILLLILFSEESQHRPLRQEYLLLLFVTLTLPFIKNEGLLATFIIGVCLSLKCLRNPKLLIIPAASLCIYYLLWKHEVIIHHIHNDLLLKGIIERGLSRLTTPSEMLEILKQAASFSGIYLFSGLLVFLFNWKKRGTANLPAIAFILLYCSGIIFAYIITPHNLIWHLSTSASRTFMVVNVCIYSYIVYEAYRTWNHTYHGSNSI